MIPPHVVCAACIVVAVMFADRSIERATCPADWIAKIASGVVAAFLLLLAWFVFKFATEVPQ